MIKHILKTGILALSIASLGVWASEDNRMDANKPEVDVQSVTTHANRKAEYSRDDKKMHAQIIAETLALDEAFDDPQLLAELDIDELASFDLPLEEDERMGDH